MMITENDNKQQAMMRKTEKGNKVKKHTANNERRERVLLLKGGRGRLIDSENKRKHEILIPV